VNWAQLGGTRLKKLAIEKYRDLKTVDRMPLQEPKLGHKYPRYLVDLFS